jgi:site-specific recombinase XerC
METTNQMIDQYLADKHLSWSMSTSRNARAQLMGYRSAITSKPSDLWAAMTGRGLKPYSMVTVFGRVTDFYEFLVSTGERMGPNPYRQFRDKNERLFRNVYSRKTPTMSFAEAKQRVEGIVDPAARKFGLELLGSGLRYSERATLNEGMVVGKGRKSRRAYVPAIEGPAFTQTYQSFYRKLRAAGLKPHDLRKLFLSHLVEQGINNFDLCEVAGWSSINTAASYIRANSQRIGSFVDNIHTAMSNE